MKKLMLALLFVSAIFTISVFARNDKPEVVKYVAPKYPPAAQAVRASGIIDVHVKIDKDGKVITAQAISGYPLLRKACEIAAVLWIFSADSNTEQREVKITFLLRIGERNKKDKIKFKKPYTLELVGAGVGIINTVNY